MQNIYPEHGRFLGREDKEQLLGQRGIVLWLFGLSGSGKSTIANEVERRLHAQGRMTVILDGDNLRSGLNKNLGFSDEDRAENVRRVSEVARLFASQGVITLVSVIAPRREFRELARETIGVDYHEIFVKAAYETCAARDPKGLYARAAGGSVAKFTGKDSTFEEPEHPDLLLDTENFALEDCVQTLLDFQPLQKVLRS